MTRIDPAEMERAIEVLLERARIHLDKATDNGIRARMTTAVLPVYFRAMAAETERGSDDEALMVAGLVLISNLLASNVQTFEDDATIENRTLNRLEHILSNTLRIIANDRGTKVFVKQAGRA